MTAALAVGCASDDDNAPTATATPEPPPTLTVRNETPCAVFVRFDNGVPIGSVAPGASAEFIDEQTDTARFLKVESREAIFRTFDMDQVRTDGYTVTVTPAVEDNPCAEPLDGAP